MKRYLTRFLAAFGVAAACFCIAGCRSAGTSRAPVAAVEARPTVTPSTKARQAALTPRQALEELKDGNARFVSARPLNRRPLADLAQTSTGQYPIAVILSCIDSRQPIELVFDQGIGDVFSARVAGNVLNDDVLGSMEFACNVSGAKLIAVVGHSNCGAIKGAIDKVESGNLTGLLARIQPVIDAEPSRGEPRSSKNHELVEAVAEDNVRLVMRQIRERSPVLREMLERGQIELAGGMYDLSSGKVAFYENH